MRGKGAGRSADMIKDADRASLIFRVPALVFSGYIVVPPYGEKRNFQKEQCNMTRKLCTRREIDVGRQQKRG
jgi:hypothetical protein